MTKHLKLLLFIALAWGQVEPDTLASEIQPLKKETLDNSVDDEKKRRNFMAGLPIRGFIYINYFRSENI